MDKLYWRINISNAPRSCESVATPIPALVRNAQQKLARAGSMSFAVG